MFNTEISIPPRVPPGNYQVKAMAVKDGAVIAAAVQPIGVKTVGFPAFLSSLSFNYGTLYGLLAVVIAIGAGLLMDVLFGGGKGAH